MRQDAFSRCHPLVNLIYFVSVICFAAVIQHPAYLAAGFLGAAVYFVLLRGKKAWKTMASLLPLFLFLAAINPLFNHSGRHVLFTVFGNPYTWESLCYGKAVAAIFVTMILWFHCWSLVLTSDRFTALFGNLIPGLSLLLVMILRMIPNFARKARQIRGARKSIGKGQGTDQKARLKEGMTVLSGLTDWAFDGSLVTADSMRARGYGTGKHTSFQIYRITLRDVCLMVLMAGCIACIILLGGTSAEFTPVYQAAPLTWGFGAYCVFLLIPTALQIKEALQWHISLSRI